MKAKPKTEEEIKQIAQDILTLLKVQYVSSREWNALVDGLKCFQEDILVKNDWFWSEFLLEFKHAKNWNFCWFFFSAFAKFFWLKDGFRLVVSQKGKCSLWETEKSMIWARRTFPSFLISKKRGCLWKRFSDWRTNLINLKYGKHTSQFLPKRTQA